MAMAVTQGADYLSFFKVEVSNQSMSLSTKRLTSDSGTKAPMVKFRVSVVE